jgi:hypothetical protein
VVLDQRTRIRRILRSGTTQYDRSIDDHKERTASNPTRELARTENRCARSIDICQSPRVGRRQDFRPGRRYLEILRAKKVSVDNIVAITFTNRAANEMRQRVRDRIDGLLRTSPERDRPTWLRHKRTLEGAVITTIHGFCSRLLHEFPVEANIDPQFVLLDEHQAAMLLESVVEEGSPTRFITVTKPSCSLLRARDGGVAAALVELHRNIAVKDCDRNDRSLRPRIIPTIWLTASGKNLTRAWVSCCRLRG